MITFADVSKIYNKELFTPSKTALDSLSFTLPKGQTLGLIGANGAGKSTTIKLLMNFISSDSGIITVNNQSPDNYQIRTNIGYLPETVNFPPNLNILNLIKFTAASCKVSRAEEKERREKWLKELDLWQVRKRPLRSYSKGMQQRANFVLALINDPDLLILDEPMSGLDPMGRDTIINLIIRLREEGKTILFCSHILDDVDRLVDNVMLLHKGEKLFHGTPKELAEQEKQPDLAQAFLSVVKREESHA